MIRAALKKAASIGIRAEVLQLVFSAGVITGFVVMALLITVPRILGILIAHIAGGLQ